MFALYTCQHNFILWQTSLAFNNNFLYLLGSTNKTKTYFLYSNCTPIGRDEIFRSPQIPQLYFLHLISLDSSSIVFLKSLSLPLCNKTSLRHTWINKVTPLFGIIIAANFLHQTINIGVTNGIFFVSKNEKISDANDERKILVSW